MCCLPKPNSETGGKEQQATNQGNSIQKAPCRALYKPLSRLLPRAMLATKSGGCNRSGLSGQFGLIWKVEIVGWILDILGSSCCQSLPKEESRLDFGQQMPGCSQAGVVMALSSCLQNVEAEWIGIPNKQGMHKSLSQPMHPLYFVCLFICFFLLFRELL